jgi:hypothetical protein
MNRRNAIKSMAWATSGVLALSYCSPLPDLAYSRISLGKKDRNLLIYLSLKIISEDPLNFPSMESREEFVLSWLNDMLTDEELKRLEQGLELFKDSFKGSFSELSDSDQQKRLIEGLKAEDLSGEFLRQIKNISTLHFRTTENYMTQYLNYEFIPGRYLGCKNRVAI